MLSQHPVAVRLLGVAHDRTLAVGLRAPRRGVRRWSGEVCNHEDHYRLSPVPACYLGDPRRANYGMFGVGTVSSLRTWLSMWSLTDSQCGLEQLRQVRVPALVIDADADTGIFPSDTAQIVAALRQRPDAPPVDTHTVAADHYLLEPPDARAQAADLITDWIRVQL